MKTFIETAAELIAGGVVSAFHTIREAKTLVAYKGRVQKEVFAVYRMAGNGNGGAYQEGVNRRRANAGLPADFEAQKINGGEWREGYIGRIINYFNGNVALRVYCTKNRQRVYWYLDGDRVAYNAVESMLQASEKPKARAASRAGTAEHQGVAEEKAMFPISISAKSIRAIKCGGIRISAG